MGITRVLRVPNPPTGSSLFGVDTQTVTEFSQLTINDRYSLTAGSYYPDEVPGSYGLENAGILTTWTGSSTITTTNGYYENYKFTQNMDLQGQNTFKNCHFAASPTSPLFGARTSNSANVFQAFVSCSFIPDATAVGTNGIQGRNFSVQFCEFAHTVDNIRLHFPSDSRAALNVVIKQCYLRDLAYFLVDPDQSNGPTHNDSIQMQGSGTIDWGAVPDWDPTGNITPRNVLIFGNTIDCGYSGIRGDYGSIPDRGTGDNTNGRYRNGSLGAVQYTNLGTRPDGASQFTTGVDVWRNKILGGKAPVNAGGANNHNIGSLWGNEFDDNQGLRSGGNTAPGQGYTVSLDATVTCAAGDGGSGYSDTARVNRYLPSVQTVGGQPITVRRNQ